MIGGINSEKYIPEKPSGEICEISERLRTYPYGTLHTAMINSYLCIYAKFQDDWSGSSRETGGGGINPRLAFYVIFRAWS